MASANTPTARINSLYNTNPEAASRLYHQVAAWEAQDRKQTEEERHAEWLQRYEALRTVTFDASCVAQYVHH